MPGSKAETQRAYRASKAGIMTAARAAEKRAAGRSAASAALESAEKAERRRKAKLKRQPFSLDDQKGIAAALSPCNGMSQYAVTATLTAAATALAMEINRACSGNEPVGAYSTAP